MPRAAQLRLPFDPLMDAAYSRHAVGIRSTRWDGRECATTPNPVADLARKIGFARRQVQRWRHAGVPLYSADIAAVRLGLHPCEIWGDAFHVGAAA